MASEDKDKAPSSDKDKAPSNPTTSSSSSSSSPKRRYPQNDDGSIGSPNSPKRHLSKTKAEELLIEPPVGSGLVDTLTGHPVGSNNEGSPLGPLLSGLFPTSPSNELRKAAAKGSMQMKPPQPSESSSSSELQASSCKEVHDDPMPMDIDGPTEPAGDQNTAEAGPPLSPVNEGNEEPLSPIKEGDEAED